MAKKKKSKLSIYVEYFGFMAVVKLVRILPLQVAYFFADLIGWLVYQFDFKHSGRAVRHILHTGFKTDVKEAKKLALASFRHMIMVFIEIVKWDQIITPENMAEHVVVADDPASKKMLDRNHPIQIILATAHIGNWELAGGFHSVYSGLPMCSIMRPLANYKIGNYFYTRRSSFNHRTVSKELGLRPLLAANKAGENITIVADQHAGKMEGVEVLSFGHPASAHATPALLHLKTHTPISFPFLIRADRKKFLFHFHATEPIRYEPTGNKAEDVKKVCQLYTTMIENEIRKFPEQWIWAHRRWLDSGRGNDQYKFGDNERKAAAEAQQAKELQAKEAQKESTSAASQKPA